MQLHTYCRLTLLSGHPSYLGKEKSNVSIGAGSMAEQWRVLPRDSKHGNGFHATENRLFSGLVQVSTLAHCIISQHLQLFMYLLKDMQFWKHSG